MALARILLVTATGLLAAGLVVQLSGSPETVTSRTAGETAASENAPPTSPDPPVVAVGMPLFRSAVRAVDAAVPSPPSVLPPPRLRLLGVIVGPGGAVAVVQREGQDRPERVKPGAQIDGWELTRIEDHAIVLAYDGAEQQILLGVGREQGRIDDPFGSMP